MDANLTINEIDSINFEYPEESSDVLILPDGAELIDGKKTWRYDVEAENTLKTLRSAKLSARFLEESDLTIDKRGRIYFLPTLLFTATLLVKNPHVVSVSLSVLANYIYDQLKATSKDDKVKVQIIIERSKKKTYIKGTYEGPAKGLEDFGKALEGAKK